jgi:UrcA family protein
MIRPLIVASIFVFATVASVQAADRVRQTTTIALADLNLADPADSARLDARIHDAAVAVCGPVEYPLGINFTQFQAARAHTEACVSQTERRTRARLAALHPQATATRMASAGH